MSIRSRIQTIIIEELQLNVKELKDTDRLTDHGANSLDAFSLIVGLEEEFSTELNNKALPDDVLKSTDTFGEAVKKLEDVIKV